MSAQPFCFLITNTSPLKHSHHQLESTSMPVWASPTPPRNASEAKNTRSGREYLRLSSPGIIFQANSMYCSLASMSKLKLTIILRDALTKQKTPHL
jgi:hypothetical protein